MRKIIFGVFLLHALAAGQSILMLMPGSRPPAPTYLHYRTLTIDHTQVGGSTLSSFPVLVTLALGSGKIQNASCFDVVFATDSAGSSRLAWELDTCNQSTGAVTAWVGLPSVSGTVDTAFYVAYDSTGVSSAQNTGSFSPATMWAAAGYLGVFHLGDGSTLTLNDSTSNGYNGTPVNSPAATSGQIGGAALMVAASSQSINIPSAMNSYGTKTCSFWLKFTSLVSFAVATYLGSDGSSFTDGLEVLGVPGTVGAYMIGAAGGRTFSPPPSVGTWRHITVAKTASLITNMYIDAVDTSTTSPGTVGSVNANIIGNNTGGGAPLDGAIDEFRLRSGTSTAGWITAEFNNQKSGSSFLTVGSEI